ncbi:AGC family protein kinase [Trichomonas vaginalis G3]|uniref:AGC family protein kinase n=1 Tax=Trichomonas vaginalis (strain ATCC PRA-98 / G3) TaxID=412133 RepID=A2DPE0_TRIV3|nr:protein serine/threonine kinase protein [Trichomonas vaginalis G3]EAY17684.1 AGC family protein kinase [Trichomonas vaginalis G3]KAI5507912.1 protein serine/threonine kinase protein [Trichomonas vaginalis G3]|eukprot:XP_001329819.1 AGC family protein kinase [Trichomonas vaginalis G3]
MCDANSEISSILLGRGFQIIKGLGNKCFPSCYLVFHQVYQQNFVCKIISKKTQYENEVLALTTLDHPNIVRLYSHFEENGKYYMILEYCEGGTPESLIKNKVRPIQNKIVNITKQLVRVFKYIHSKRIAHHDIKPSNILFDKYGRIKIADFGLSGYYSTNESHYNVGSYGYLAPEQRTSHAFDPFLADIWSLGVTIYYMTCGLNPFIKQKNSYKYIIPMFVERSLAEVISGTLEEDPLKRLSLDKIEDILTARPKLTIPSHSWYNFNLSENIPVSPQGQKIRHGKSAILKA